MLLVNVAEKAVTLDWGTVIIGIIIIMCLSQTINSFGTGVYKYIKRKVLGEKASDDVKDALKNLNDRLFKQEKSRTREMEKIDILSNDMEYLKEAQEKHQERSLALNEAIIEILYDKVSQRCRYYINELHGIPEDDVESFNRIFAVYSACGGNHGLGRKVEYCNNNLPILPPIVPKEHE